MIQNLQDVKLALDWAYVNPFTGYIYLSDLKIFESQTDSIFLSAKSVSANFAMRKLLKKTYEINEITLVEPVGYIIQNKKALNFDDLIQLFSPKGKPKKNKKPIQFNILNIKIKDGEFHYLEQQLPINYFIKHVNIESSGKWWDKDSLEVTFSFVPGIGNGKAKGNGSINFENLNYRLNAVITQYDLDFIQQYLNDITNYGSFRASLDANITSKGNFKNPENINARGLLAFHNFHFGKNTKEDFASFDKLVVAITELSPKNHKYLFDSIALTHPYFKYERYDKLDNVQTMFGKKGSKITSAAADESEFNLVIEIARYVKLLAKNFFRSNYKINRVAIYEGDLKFNDFSTSEKFSIALNPINATADSIDKKHKRVSVALVSGLKPYGNGSVTLSINPKDSSDFDLNYHFQKLPVTLFNPYLITYTSFPLDRGTLELKGTWKVRNGEINSDNHLTVIDPRVSSRLQNKDTKWLPMRVIMSFVRERGNVIDYEIPISGNLNNPKFHLRDVIFDVVTNIFVKPATTPYRIQVRNIETEIEKSMSFKWDMRSSQVSKKQRYFIEKMALFLQDNPNASITITPHYFSEKEKEYLLLFEAKKRYSIDMQLTKAGSMSESDSLSIAKMSTKDSSFVKYLNRHIKDSMLFTIQDKCLFLIGATIINQRFATLNAEREQVFLSYFIEKEVVKQVHMHPGKTSIPYNGFSYYQIEYKGEFPESLLKAYSEMMELNDESPRKKFKEERRKNKNSNFENKPLKEAKKTNESK